MASGIESASRRWPHRVARAVAIGVLGLATLVASAAPPRDVAPETRTRDLAAESSTRQAAADSRTRHVAPDARSRHVAPETRARRVAPDARTRHVAPEPRARRLAPEPRARQRVPDARARERAVEPIAESIAEAGGFIVAFAPKPAADGRLALQRLSAMSAPPGPRTHELDPSRDWHVRWIDADGRRLGEQRIPDPLTPLLGTADPRQPLFVRFADRRGAVLAELRDARGTLRGEVPLDARARLGAERLRQQGELRQAAAAARAAKLAAAEPAAAAHAVAFQVEVQQRLDDKRTARCASRAAWRAPERVVADPCRTAEGGGAITPIPAHAAARWPVPAAPARGIASDTLRGRVVVPPKRGSAAAEGYVLLTGHLRFPEGSAPPTVPITMYSWGAAGNGGGYVLTVQPPDYMFTSQVLAGESVYLEILSPAPFLKAIVPLGVIDADTYREVMLERGVAVSGRVRFPPGLPAPEAPVPVFFQDDVGNGGTYYANPPDFAFAWAFPAGGSVNVDANPPVPYTVAMRALGVVDADRSADLIATRGVVVTGDVTGTAADYFVMIRDMIQGGQPQQQFHSGTPTFDAVVPAIGGVVEVFADGHFPSAPYLPVGGADARVDFALDPRPAGPNVTLTLKNAGGGSLEQARAEVWRGGRLFTSGLSDFEGIVQLELPNGTFEIRVWPDTEQVNQWAYDATTLFADPAIVAPLTVSGFASATLKIDLADWNQMRVLLPSEPSFAGCSGPPFGRLELVRDGIVVARGALRDLDANSWPGGGHRLITGRGKFVLRYAMPGGVVWQSAPFTAASNGTIALSRVGTAPRHEWTGTLRTHDGTPVPLRDITISDELGITVWPTCPVRSDAAGKFRLPLCEGCVYSFTASASNPSQRRIVRIDTPVAASRELDVHLREPLAFQPLAPSGASRVYGRADAPIKLVFLAEGYVAQKETFTDANGNGLWDGIQWVDIDGNGLWQTGEPISVYGAAQWPAENSNPKLTNEPFVDQNGDGVLSIDDRALFERNVRDYLRGLFSSDQFATYRDAYQATAVMGYSAQAGMDHGTLTRDTLFGAQYEVDRGLISADYGAAYEAAAAATPGFTVVVVMINQPVPYGRVNSFILASGGVLGGNVNDNVAAHEFGHNPGGLGDEYSEFAGTAIGYDPASPNGTRHVDRALVAWGARVPAILDGRPTKPWMAQDGFFEGAGYYPSGLFRPAHASMMRYMDSLLFNGASVDQLRRVHARALRGTPGRLTLSGATRNCREYAAAWDVAAIGTSAVELRVGAYDGPVAAVGGATGSTWLKPYGEDLYLVDVATGLVLDVAAVPVVRCTPPTIND